MMNTENAMTTMATKPEALRLADRLEGRWALHPDMQEAAAELRRLHKENELLAGAADKLRMSHSEERRELLRQRDQATAHHAGLLEALKMMTAHYCNLVNSGDAGNWAPDAEPEVLIARAAIKTVEKNT